MPHILFNRKVATDYYKMRILCPAVAAKAKPGQFVMIRVTDGCHPLLRRPFAIHRVCFERDTAKALWQTKGRHAPKNSEFRGLLLKAS